MAKIDSKDWYAAENRMPPVDPKAVPFYVIGKVLTNNGSIQPKLTEADPQGINPEILILDLTLEQVGDVGTADVAYRDVRFDKTIEMGQFTQVSIRHGGEDVTLIDVQIVS